MQKCLWEKTVVVVLLCLFAFNYSGARTITEPNLGFTIAVPDGWKGTLNYPISYSLVDTSNVHRSTITVSRYDIESDIADSVEWDDVQSYAYDVLVESNPIYGVVFSRQSFVHNNKYYCVQVNAEYADTATFELYSECVRYIGEKRDGYEISVLGDTVDIDTNYTYYMNIVNSVVLLGGTGINNKTTSYSNSNLKIGGNFATVYNISGQKVFDIKLNSFLPTGDIINVVKGRLGVLSHGRYLITVGKPQNGKRMVIKLPFNN